MTQRYFAADDRRDELASLVEQYPALANEFQRRYQMSWLYHENALEGLVLSEQEIIQALEVQVVADASLMQVITLLRNHKLALDLIRDEAASKKPKLSLTLFKTLFETLQRGVNGSEDKGFLRTEMPLHRTYYHEISHPSKIQAELQKLVEVTGTSEFRQYHPIRQAAYVHWQFMQVFPYVIHNGRIARLLQNIYMLRSGYPLAIVHAIDRQRYYDSLRMPLAALRSLIAEALDNSLENAVRFIVEKGSEQRRAASE